MKPIVPKPQRCAIYTRKSTEHNLDLEFNSLDAQREACEAYVKSQAHEGWRLVPDRYDDGGLSGASLPGIGPTTLCSRSLNRSDYAEWQRRSDRVLRANPHRRGITLGSALCVLCRYRHKGHWSGHKSRLDRDLTNRFGNRAYAAEELVAELARPCGRI